MTFPKTEFQNRVAKLQARMETEDVSALLLTTPPDVFYVTGFLTRFWESPARPWFVIVPVSGDPVAVIPAIGGALMRSTWIKDIRTWAAPDLADDGVSLLSDTLKELVPQSGRIALPMGHETHLRMPVADYERVKVAISPRSLSSSSSLRSCTLAEGLTPVASHSF